MKVQTREIRLRSMHSNKHSVYLFILSRNSPNAKPREAAKVSIAKTLPYTGTCLEEKTEQQAKVQLSKDRYSYRKEEIRLVWIRNLYLCDIGAAL